MCTKGDLCQTWAGGWSGWRRQLPFLPTNGAPSIPVGLWCFTFSLCSVNKGRCQDMQHLRIQPEVIWSFTVVNGLCGRQERKNGGGHGVLLKCIYMFQERRRKSFFCVHCFPFHYTIIHSCLLYIYVGGDSYGESAEIHHIKIMISEHNGTDKVSTFVKGTVLSFNYFSLMFYGCVLPSAVCQ